MRNYCQQRLKMTYLRRLNRLNNVWQTSGLGFELRNFSQAEFGIRKLETRKFAKKIHQGIQIFSKFRLQQGQLNTE